MARQTDHSSIVHALLGIALIGMASAVGSSLAQQPSPQQGPRGQAVPLPNLNAPAARQDIEPPVPEAGQGVDLQVRAIDAATGKGLGGSACETVVLAANERKQVRLKQISAPEFK
jgi:hypothetical protein